MRASVPLKTEALQLALECWLDPSLKNYSEAIQRGSAWLGTVRDAEEREPEWLGLRLLLAKAYLAQSQELAATGETSKEARAAEQARSEARQLAVFVSKHAGPHQAEAQDILVRLGRPVIAKPATPPSTFAEAKDAGRDAIEALQTAALLVARVSENAGPESDAQAKAQLEKELAEAEQSLRLAREEAESTFSASLEAGRQRHGLGRSQSRALLSGVRVLCRFAISRISGTGRLCGPPVSRQHIRPRRGEDCVRLVPPAVCRKSPSHRGHSRLDGSSPARNSSFSGGPISPSRRRSLERLVPLLTTTGRFAEAARFLALVPAESPQRTSAEILLGHALWTTYLREKTGTQPPPSGTDSAGQADAERLTQLRTQAEEMLVSSLKGLPATTLDAAAAAGALSLAQLYVETQRPDQAITVLENPQYGALALIAKDDSLAQQAGFTEEAYKTALRSVYRFPRHGHQSRPGHRQSPRHHGRDGESSGKHA